LQQEAEAEAAAEAPVAMPRMPPDTGLDDVQVMGAWNFTLQADTPLHWIRSGSLQKYHMRFCVRSHSPSTCGLVFHAEADGAGTDGVSFWIERRAGRDGQEGNRRYLLAGAALESKAIVTRAFPDAGGELSEEVEVLLQGFSGAIFLQDRKVQLTFRTKHDRGSLAFYNSTRSEVNDDVNFSGVRITAIRKGPLEVAGFLHRREKAIGSTQDLASSSESAAGHQIAGSGALSPSAHGQVQTLRGARVPGQWDTQRTPKRATSSVLRRSASESVLSRSPGASASALHASTRTPHGRRDHWVPLAKNAHASEHALLKDATRPKKSAAHTSCSDFIAIER